MEKALWLQSQSCRREMLIGQRDRQLRPRGRATRLGAPQLGLSLRGSPGLSRFGTGHCPSSSALSKVDITHWQV